MAGLWWYVEAANCLNRQLSVLRIHLLCPPFLPQTHAFSLCLYFLEAKVLQLDWIMHSPKKIYTSQLLLFFFFNFSAWCLLSVNSTLSKAFSLDSSSQLCDLGHPVRHLCSFKRKSRMNLIIGTHLLGLFWVWDEIIFMKHVSLPVTWGSTHLMSAVPDLWGPTRELDCLVDTYSTGVTVADLERPRWSFKDASLCWSSVSQTVG